MKLALENIEIRTLYGKTEIPWPLCSNNISVAIPNLEWQMRISVLTSSVSLNRKFGKNSDGQDSASNAHPLLSTHQLLTQSARQENRRHQTRHAYPSNTESKHPLLRHLSGSNISVPIPNLVRQMHLEKQGIGKPLQAKCISLRTHINLLNSWDRVTNDRALNILMRG